MIWLGTHTPRARTGVPLKDNGICAIDETGIVFAIAEERLSGDKHDTGHARAYAACLDAVPEARDARVIGVSSCTDAPWSAKQLDPGLSALRAIPTPSHHHTHALSCFLPSPFDESLILVMDAGGNTLGTEGASWWDRPREQTSLWFGHRDQITLLERRHLEPEVGGFGEWYRAFTYFLGWHRSTLAGNTMALAGFGDADAIHDESLFDLDTLPPLRPNHPIEMVGEVLAALGHGHIQPREPGAAFTQDHYNAAAYLQYSLETTLRRWVGVWSARYGTRNLCLTGGVAQNCRANAELADMLGSERVFVSPFAGDTGQCVGNALYLRALDLPGAPRPRLRNMYLGPSYSDAQYREALAETEFAGQRFDDDALAAHCADALMAGQVVAICRGRSEFGPRALGHRSVIGDPCAAGVAERIKRAVKRRDEFMPLAPFVDTELAAAWGSGPLSETMVFAPRAPAAAHRDLGSCLHVDATARVQVATADADLFAPVLREFRARSGRGALINTSYNRRGRPMAETPRDALNAFAELDIDALILGPYWVAKTAP